MKAMYAWSMVKRSELYILLWLSNNDVWLTVSINIQLGAKEFEWFDRKLQVNGKGTVYSQSVWT